MIRAEIAGNLGVRRSSRAVTFPGASDRQLPPERRRIVETSAPHDGRKSA